jgi:hypothetical protein
MNAMKLLEPVSRTLSKARPRKSTFASVPGVLGFRALSGRNNRYGKLGLLLVGGAAFALWRSKRGREWMTQIGKSLGGVVGGEIGAHPVRTAELAQTASKLISSART